MKNIRVIFTTIVGILLLCSFCFPFDALNNALNRNNNGFPLSVGFEIQKNVSMKVYEELEAKREQNLKEKEEQQKAEDLKNLIIEDTLYIGDSLTVGMNNAVNLEENSGNKVIASIGCHIGEATKAIENVEGFKRVIITIGSNSYNLPKDEFIKQYGSLVDKARQNNPDAEIFLNSMPVVDDFKAFNAGYRISNDVISKKNELISELAEEKDVKYIDSYSFLDDIGIKTNDGLHMQPETYKLWYDYIKTQLV